MSLNTRYISDTVMGAKDTVINKTVEVLTSQNLCSGDGRQTIDIERKKVLPVSGKCQKANKEDGYLDGC